MLRVLLLLHIILLPIDI